MDSCLEDMEKKGNLDSVPELYNPRKHAEKVVHFTPCPRDVEFSSVFREWNIEIFPYFSGGSRLNKLFLLIPSVIRIYRKIIKARLNVVRGRLPYLGSFIGCLIGKIRKIPTVVSLGGNNRIGQEENKEYYYGSKLISYSMERLVLKMATVLHVPNLYTKKYVAGIIGEKSAEKKTVVIPWILSEEESSTGESFDIHKAFSLDSSSPYLLHVGFLNRYKQTDVLFEAIRLIRIMNYRTIQFVFCGDGPLRIEGEGLFRDDPRVYFLGWQKREMARALIEKARIMLIPMSGFVLLESAAAGRPVIASNIEWHSEIIEDGRTGLLVNAKSPEEWANHIREMLDEDESSLRMGAQLKGRYESDYHPRVTIQKEIDLYQKVLNREFPR